MTYSKIEENQIAITIELHNSKVVRIDENGETKTNSRGMMFDLGRGKASTFSDQDFIDAEWLPHVYDVPGDYQYRGQTLIVEADLINRDIIDRTDDEILDIKINNFQTAVQRHLDSTAQSWGYDHILSLCTYEGNSNPKYSAEGEAGKSWRSGVWTYCYTELEKIKDGKRQEPESVESFIAELPVIVRPL